jgi:predicted homoserine dehydrogenase-like protein
VLAGNIKGFLDRYRNPETQRGFAEKTGQSAGMVTSFADGTKLSMEACLVANATGLQVGQRGMFGPKCAHVKDILQHFTPSNCSNGPSSISPWEPSQERERLLSATTMILPSTPT